MPSLVYLAPGSRLISRKHKIHRGKFLRSLVLLAALLAWDANGQPFEPSKWKTFSVKTGANVREGRSADYPSILVLPKGTPVRTATEYTDLDAGDIYSLEELDWAEVELPDGRRGFIASHLLDENDDVNTWAAMWLLYSAIAVPFIARWKNRGKTRWALSSFFLFIPGLVIPFMPKASEQGDEVRARVAKKSSEQAKPTASSAPAAPDTMAPRAPIFRRHAFQCVNCGAQNEVSIRENLDSGHAICEYCGAPDRAPQPPLRDQRPAQRVTLDLLNDREDVHNPDAVTVNKELRLAFSQGSAVIMHRGDDIGSVSLQTDGEIVEASEDGEYMQRIVTQGMLSQEEIIALFQDFAAGGNQHQQWERLGPAV